MCIHLCTNCYYYLLGWSNEIFVNVLLNKKYAPICLKHSFINKLFGY